MIEIDDSIEKELVKCKGDNVGINYKGNLSTFKQFFNSIKNFFVMVELKKNGTLGCFLDVDDILSRKLSYSKDEFLKMTPYEIAGIDKEEIEDILENLLYKGKINADITYTRESGEKYIIEISNYIFDLSEKRVIIVTAHNILERKKVINLAEKVYEETEERYRKLVELLPDAVHVKYNGKIVFSNEAGAKLLGYDYKEKIIGRYDKEFTHPDYQKISIKRGNIMRKEKSSAPALEQKVVRADGQIIDVEVASAPIKFNGDCAILSVIRDITERKKWERMLSETLKDNRRLLEKAIELDKQRTEFFSNISHEFKTPLNVILGSIQLLENLKKNIEFEEDFISIYKYISIMKQNCYRLLRLINNLIDINKADSKFLEAKFCNHDIVHIIEDITLSVADFGKNKGLRLIFDTEVEEKIISCDVDKIERIMLNLLSNSIKYTENGGDIYVNVHDLEEKIIISVIDTGIGIPEDKLKTIFERFEQIDSSLSRKKEGSGIGLSLVKSFVELHGGRIWAESRIGEGTQFFIELPASLVDEKNVKRNYNDYSSNLVERINVEFSDIYS
ncbi:PAS domain-containing sensor histidine kinase [Wukongibacter baidiensis]|uniref:sensor histidine kinase n=1 Tax=Wukongibacter baidiensis TaxID=1723361 RepID=UPI003D7F9DB1